MGKIRYFLPLIFYIAFMLCACEVMKPVQKPVAELRGVWVSSVINLDYPSRPGLSAAELKKEAVTLLDRAADMGINAVFFQVRPCSDALYNSSKFPWSSYLTGTQGKAPEDNFDPLAFWISEAHKRGIKLHAWINPLRITQGGSEAAPKLEKSKLAENHPARLHPEWCVGYKGNLYFDPGIPEVRDYIKGGVEELVLNYDIDGIHFDDYFYPGVEFNDAATFAKYGKGYNEISDWRRENINVIIRETGELVDSLKPKIEFGVSPFAIWQNKDSTQLGSETHGMESYKTFCSDSRKWVRNEWVDYIAPQIYWNIGNKEADYEKLLTWWVEVVKNTRVKLYIGHAGYRVVEANPGDVWYGADEILRQLEMNKRFPEVSGSIHFRLGTYLQCSQLARALREEYKS